MSWLDLLYFSKGERTGLIVLLTVVVIAVTILFVTRKTEPADNRQVNDASNNRNVTEQLAPADTASSEKGTSSEKGASSEQPVAGKTTVASTAGTAVQKAPSSQNTRESTPQRVNRMTSYSQPSYTRQEKFEEGTVVELNTADTTTLKKVPGIGSAFARRIVNYRAILGGYHTVIQLGEVYGIDEERYQALHLWFTADPSHVKKLQVNTIQQDSLQRHPYISYAQARAIMQQRRQKGKLTGWENLQLLNEFTESDITRLQPYLSFD